MKRKSLLIILLLALMVPLAALAQVERTVTDGPTSTVETNQTRAITDNNSPIHIRYANFVTTNSAWIVFDCDLEYDFGVSGVYSGHYYIRYKTESMSNWSEERSFNVEYNGGTPYCNFEYVCSITPYTRYTVQIRCFINNAYCEWSDEFSFATLCPATATPYNVDFNGLSALPQYWRVETGTGNAYSVANDQLSVSTTSGNPLDAYVILPYFENLSTLQLSFNATRTAGSCNEMQVGFMTDPFDANTFIPLQTLTLSEATTTYGSSLLEASAQHGHIAIKLNDATEEQHSVWFDDFAVTRLQALDNLAVDVTNSSATLSWTTIAPSVQIQYREADGTWSGSITPEGNSYTITGLTESTNYEAQIRANFTSFNSDWESFGTFKTLMQEAYTMGASANHTYTEGFETTNHGWILNNGASTNYWCRSWDAGIHAQINPHTSSNKSIYITDGTTTGSNLNQRPTWQYAKMNVGLVENIARPSIVYLTKIFNLSAGQYTFNFDYKVMGTVGEDYLRVFLLPAAMELTGAGSSNFPDGYQNWYYLDNGTQVAQTPNNNTVDSEYVSFGEGSNLHNVVNVYEGGDVEPGNYMMVFAWRNEGSTRVNDAVQYPAAIDNVSVAWSPLITPPDMNTLVVAPTDTQATLTWDVPTCTLTPTGYEVEYATEASFTDALTASTNTTSVTLTGLTANTNYNVRIRSACTANGTTIYSDWSDARVFSTNYPTPTNLTLVRQTTSMAQVMWTPVELTLPEGQRINYTYQLTTDPDDWGADNPGLSSNGWERNLAPGNYHFRVKTAVYDNSTNSIVGESNWSEPIQFTIAPWTDPVTLFPLTYGFETPTYFDDGLTLGGALERLDIYNYSNAQDQLPAHAGGESQRLLGFASGSSSEAYLVLPPLRPSTSDALVSFWWYHDNTEANQNIGVTIEQSSDGTSWSQCGSLIPRYAETSGWVKYQQVVPAGGTDPIYIRLHFVGANSDPWYKRCYLDDLTVTTFKSEQPYISYVGCDAYTATITLYDYAYQNGWPSSAFHVQYRKVGQDTWIDYADFVNQAPYAFENSLAINGLDPNSYYEFRACARVSYNGNDFAWSNYCEPYRQWTSNDVFTVTPTHPYEHDFEFGAYNWTEGSWDTQYTTDHHNGAKCAYMSNASVSELVTPAIQFDASCNNVIIRFWVKGSGRFYVYHGENYAQSTVVNTIPSKSSWTKVEYSLSKYMNYGTLKVAFRNDYTTNTPVEMYIDDIEIIANEYGKIFDCQPGSSKQWSNSDYWYPHAVPTAGEDVKIMGYVYVGYTDGSNPYTAHAGNVSFGSYGYVQVFPGSILEATSFNISMSSNVMIADGGQLKVGSPTMVTMYKRITGYDNENGRDHWYLFAPPFSWSNNSSFTSGDYDLYHFDGSAELEWINHKNPVNNAMQRGKGYLYAHAKPTSGNNNYTSITMGGTVLKTTEDQTFTGLTYGVNTEEMPFYNWNLVGNPFPCNAYLVRNGEAVPFYKMNETGDAIVPARAGTVIKPMEGVFVVAENEDESTVTFTTTEPALGDEPEAIMPSIPNHALAENQDALLLVNQTIAMVSGWNWFAPMVQITAAQLNSMLNGCLTQIMAKDEENVNGELNPGQMYKLYSTAVVNGVAVTGVPVSSSITIGTGSNWIGYTGETTTDIAAALTTLLGASFTSNEGDKIISQDGGFAIYNGTTWQGTLTQLTQGQGYVYVRY